MLNDVTVLLTGVQCLTLCVYSRRKRKYLYREKVVSSHLHNQIWLEKKSDVISLVFPLGNNTFQYRSKEQKENALR